MTAAQIFFSPEIGKSLQYSDKGSPLKSHSQLIILKLNMNLNIKKTKGHSIVMACVTTHD